MTSSSLRLKRLLRSNADLYYFARCCTHPYLFEERNKFNKAKRLLRNTNFGKLSDENCVNNLIVSLTSYGKRLESVDLAIRSLLLQSLRPKKICLWLDKSVEIKNLPARLLELCNYGLEINANCDDLFGHKKYWYAMKAYPSFSIVTVDDDLIYPQDLIESLVDVGDIYPDCVIARRVHRIRFSEDGMPFPYSDWDYEWQPSFHACHDLLATTGAGVLYRPTMYKELLYDWSDIKQVAPKADDLWMKGAEISAGIDVVWAVNDQPMPFEIPTVRVGRTLSDSNCTNGENDEAWLKVLAYFNLGASDFI